MARIRHRIFDIYETHEEATRALTPKTERIAKESSEPSSWTFEHLAVSRAAGVTHVQFVAPETFTEATVAGLREDFAQLADKLGMDSKVLVDFTGIVLFQAAFIDALLVLSRKLRTKGSRIALCCLAPTARAFFFAPEDRDRQGPPR